MNNGYQAWTNWAAGVGFESLTFVAIASVLLIGVVWVFMLTQKRISSANRYCVWQVAFCGLLILPFGVWVLPEVPLGFFADQATAFNVESDESLVRDSLFGKSSQFDGDKFLPVKSAVVSQTPSALKQTEFENGIKSFDQASPIVGKTDWQSQIAGSKFNWRLAAMGIWLFGFGWLMFRIFVSQFRLNQIVKRSVNAKNVNDQTSPFMPLGFPVRTSAEVDIPFTVGIIKPLIILPDSSDDWSRQQLEIVLKHELAHVRRFDVAWQIFVSFVVAVVWFNPLAWVAQRQMRMDREHACDDRVLLGGVKPSDYAMVLLELATKFSGQNEKLLGALSMAQKPVEKRLSSILAATTRREPVQAKYQCLIACLVFVLVAMICSLRPFDSVAAANVVVESTSVIQEDDSDLAMMPDEVVGKVIDNRGEPVVDALVELTIYSPSDGAHPTFAGRKIKIPAARTDVTGKYTLNTSGIRINPTYFGIWGFITADGRPDYRMADNVRNLVDETGKKKQVKIHDAVMNKGRKVVGQFVAPNGRSDPPKNVFVKLMGDAESPAYLMRWNSRTIKCDDDGRFEVIVPKIGRVEVTATASNYAGVQIPVPPKTDDLGKVELKNGTSVFGKVLDEKGNPVGGVVVRMTGKTFNDLQSIERNGMYSPISLSALTDELGRYSFPPFAGENRISIEKSGSLRGSDEFVASDTPLPVITPKLIDLTDKPQRFEFNLVAGPTSKLSGRIVWDDGKPAVDVQVLANVMSGGTGVDVDVCFTDEQGDYTLRVPKGIASAKASISASGVRGKDNMSYFPHPRISDPGADELVVNRRTQSMQFTNVDQDIGGLDWELKPDARSKKKNQATGFTASVKAKESKLAFHEISQRYEKNRAMGVAPFRKELLEFEEKYRGEFSAVLALGMVGQWSDMDPVSRDQVFKILNEHYIKSAHIDLIFMQIETQLYDPKFIRFVEKVVEENPHEYVRAAAMYSACIHLNQQLQNRVALEENDWVISVQGKKLNLADVPGSAEENFGQGAYWQQLYRSFNSFEVDLTRQKMKSMIDLIDKDYSEIQKSGLLGYVGQGFATERHSPGEAPTYADELQNIKFELENLQPGKVAPEISSTDFNGKEFSLEALRGKTVLLFFDRAIRNPNLGLYSELKKKLEDEPFEIVGVMNDLQKESVEQAISDHEIKWPVIWDGRFGYKNSGLVTKKWNCVGSANVFLIDKNGVIQRRMLDSTINGQSKELEQRIKLLMRRTN